MKKGIVPAFATQIRGLSGCAHSMRSTLNPPTITFSTQKSSRVENVIVGGFNVLRMLWAQPDNPLIWVAKAGMIPFFIVHYGMFTTVHGAVAAIALLVVLKTALDLVGHVREHASQAGAARPG